MRWDDLLYGEIEIPEEVWKLFAHPLLIRLRGISQAVLPLEANPFTALNRFWHGIGVWWLAKVLTARPEFRQRHIARNLPLAGLLHDAGNPPFSHIGEWFMKEAIGHDGETHLRELLLGSELAHALERLGADPPFVCNLVAGRAAPTNSQSSRTGRGTAHGTAERCPKSTGRQVGRGNFPARSAAEYRV